MKEKEESYSGFSFFTLEKGRVEEIGGKNKDGFCFLFLLEGEGLLLSPEGLPVCLHPMECTLVPIRGALYVQAKGAVRCVTLSFVTPPSLSALNLLSDSPPLGKEKSVLPILPLLKQFLDSTLTISSDMGKDGDWQELKIYELFLVFKYSYSSYGLGGLFLPLQARQSPFRQQIQHYLPLSGSIRELLALTGMKRTTFEKRFRREFGTSPYQWLLKRKAAAVKKSLCHSSLPLEEVRRLHGFNSGSHFVRFCRREFGMNPSRLRKQDK